MLGPTLSHFDFIFSHLNYCLFFLLSFSFPFYPQFSHLQFIFSSTSHCLKIGFASLKYNQSPRGFDTRTSILNFTISDKLIYLSTS